MQEAIATWADMPAWVTQIRDSYMSANASGKTGCDDG